MKQTVDALMTRAAQKAIENSASMRFADVTAVDTTARTLTVDLAGVSVANVPSIFILPMPCRPSP